MEKMILTVVPAGFGLPNSALFSIKAEVLLRLSGLDYGLEPGRPDKAPKGKLPFLTDGEHVIPDSSHIQQYLENEKGIDFDGHLTNQQRSEMIAFRRLVEDHLYFSVLHSLWIDHAEIFRDVAFGEVPKLMRSTVFRMVQKRVQKSLHAQGFGRHTQDEIYAFGLEDLVALETRIEEAPFFFGEKISSIDASVFGVLLLLSRAPLTNPLTEFVKQSQVLTGYVDRMHTAIYNETASVNKAA